MSVANIKQENGNVNLYIDGRLVPPLVYHIADRRNNVGAELWQKNIANFHKIGMDFVGIYAYLFIDWKEEGYTGESLMENIKNTVKANPEAKILVRLNLTPPTWWMRAHPDELIKYHGVLSADCKDEDLITGDKTNQNRASFLSKAWRKDVNGILRQIVKMIRSSPYKDNVVALQPAYGTCGEWHMYGQYYYDKSGVFEGDYSQPMLDFFRKYLKKKYKTVGALQAAWGGKVTFENAQLAPPSLRKAYKEEENYLFPETDMRALDSLKCFQLAAPTAIQEFAKTIKRASKGRLLVGSFYGYHFGCGNVYVRLLEPHLLLQDENIDYLAAPAAYTANKRSGNAVFLRYLAESVRLHGKMFLCEMDQGYRSYCCYRKDPGNEYICESNAEYNALMTRNIMENVIRGMGSWYFDHKHPADPEKVVGYWEDEELLEGIRRVYEVCKRIKSLRPAFEKTADVLIVYDAETIYHLGEKTEVHNTYCQFDMADAIGKSGAGYDLIYLKDIAKCNIDGYKCVLFIDCVQMRQEEYRYIQERVMGGGRTVAFMGTNGYIVEGKTGLDNVNALLQTATEAGDFAENRGEYTLVNSKAFRYDKEFYQKLFKDAGAHIYTEDGLVICADNNLVMVHAKQTKNSRLRLACGEVELPDQKHFTAVYDNKTGERLI